MNDTKPVDLLLVDDQILFVESLRIVITERARDMRVVDIALDGSQAVAKAELHRPDLILMDVRMEGMDGVQATRIIHRLHPEIRIVMLTTFGDDDYVKDALKCGACGYLLKNMPPDELIETVRGIRRGVTNLATPLARRLVGASQPGEPDVPAERLTKRENEILGLLLAAHDNHEIARELGLSEQTVRNHIHAVYEKTGVSGRMQLIKRYLSGGS